MFTLVPTRDLRGSYLFRQSPGADLPFPGTDLVFRRQAIRRCWVARLRDGLVNLQRDIHIRMDNLLEESSPQEAL